jgi:5-methylcytosine-specific restriction protein B
MQPALQAYLNRVKGVYPTFERFGKGDEEFAKNERDYKLEIISLFKQNINPGLRALPDSVAEQAELGRKLLKLFSHKLSDGKPQNLVGWRYFEFAQHLDTDQQALFARLTAALLYGPDALAKRVDQFVQGLGQLSGKGEGNWAAMSRSVTSFLLMLSDPQTHVIIKTSQFGRAMQVFIGQKIPSRNLTGQDYLQFQQFLLGLRDEMDRNGLAPRDLIDVQSFLWVGDQDYDIGKESQMNDDMNDVEQGVADQLGLSAANDQQDLLRHFKGHPYFLEQQPLWSSITTELFIRLARAVNSKGLDWWSTTTTNNQFSFGRKEKGGVKGKQIGGLFLSKADILVYWSAFASLEKLERTHLTEAIVQKVESIRRDVGDWPSRFDARHERPGYLPDAYSSEDKRVEDESSYHRNNQPKNQILFGPAGTGKTYHSINKALEIIDPAFLQANSQPEQRSHLKQRFDELVNEQRIRFVTFHQSFSYEDFVEGISAAVEQPEGAAAEAKLGFEIKPGIFKQICDAASTKTITYHSSDNIDLQGKRIWKMSLGVAGYEDDVFDYCMQHDVALLGWGEELDFSSCNSRQEISQFMQDNNMADYLQQYPSSPRFVDVFKHDVKTGDIIIVSDGNTKFRAIGIVTGEYALHHDAENSPRYVQKRPVKWLKSYEPSLSYDLLFKKRLTQISLYELGDGTIKREQLTELLKPQAKEEIEASKPYVLIIDEINRGNISRIFGELITLIEESKREGAAEALSVVLPYSKAAFSVPDNVYIIGTMNSSDRSLTGLDIALRRRFTFTEMQPNPACLEGVYVEGVDIQCLLTAINQRIEILLDRDHCIGHAYFMPLVHTPSLTALKNIFQQKIIPLLQEYFFDDWQRIDWVLGQNGMLEKQYKDEVSLVKLFPAEALPAIQNNVWVINPKSFGDIERYYKCYANVAG